MKSDSAVVILITPPPVFLHNDTLLRIPQRVLEVRLCEDDAHPICTRSAKRARMIPQWVCCYYLVSSFFEGDFEVETAYAPLHVLHSICSTPCCPEECHAELVCFDTARFHNIGEATTTTTNNAPLSGSGYSGYPPGKVPGTVPGTCKCRMNE